MTEKKNWCIYFYLNLANECLDVGFDLTNVYKMLIPLLDHNLLIVPQPPVQ